MPSSPLGEFEVLVLMAVLRLGDEANGSRVYAEIEERTGRRIERSAVYTTLDRLERKRLLTSRVTPPSLDRAGRPKRLYHAQPAGVRAVEHALTALDRMRAGLRLAVNPR